MKHLKIVFCLLALFCGIGSFVFFYQAYPYHLQHREQMLLFTYTWEQFSSYFNHPAVLTCLLGDFFTQFFCLKVTGALIVAVSLGILEIISFLTFRKWMNNWIALGLSMVVFAWEGLRFCDILYPLSGTFSLIGGFLLFLCIDRLKGRWSFLVGSLFAVFIGYYLLGYGMLIFAICIAINSLIRWKQQRHYQQDSSNVSFTTNHPNSTNCIHNETSQITKSSSQSCLCIQNSITFSLSNILIILIAAILPKVTANHFLVMPDKAYTYPATVWKGKPNFNNEHILALSTEYYNENWNKVIELAYQGKPSNDVSICYNLANAMQGHLADRLMYYYQPAGLALFMPVYEESTYLTTQLAGEVWFRLGDMTMAEHASILSMIFSPDNKSSRMVKRLAEINLINGETEAALKYLNILSKTLHYKDWAKERMPGKESQSFKKWLTDKRQFIPKQDTLRLSSTDVVKSLHTLLDSNINNKMARDYLLCFHLLMKDINSFITDYQKYYKEKPNRLYAEALMIHLFQQHANAKEVKATGIHPSVIKDFNMFNRANGQSQGNASALENQFGHTYWFYFQFMKFD